MLNNNTEVNSNNSGYNTIDCTGANMWSVKPELKTVDGELGWFLPSEYNGNSSALLLTSISSAVLPLLLNNLGIKFKDMVKIYDEPRIFKITLTEVEDEKVITTN